MLKSKQEDGELVTQSANKLDRITKQQEALGHPILLVLLLLNMFMNHSREKWARVDNEGDKEDNAPDHGCTNNNKATDRKNTATATLTI